MDEAKLASAIALKKQIAHLTKQQNALLAHVELRSAGLIHSLQDGLELDEDVIADILARQLMSNTAALAVAQKAWDEL